MKRHTNKFYIKRYNQLRDYAINSGIAFPYKSVTEFASDWEEHVVDGSKQILRDMKYELKYQTKYSVAITELKALRLQGDTTTKLKDLKTITVQEFAENNKTALNAMYNEKKKEGLSGKAAAEFISTYWFGSK